MCVHERASKGVLEKFGPSVSSLPDDVLQRILGLLPLPWKLACRCVCRSWNSILSTDNLLLYTSNTIHRSPGLTNARLLLTTIGPFACTLDPASNSWHKLPKPWSPGASVLAAAYGLVCIGNLVSECRSLLIFNLATNTWKRLPNMLHVGLLHKVTMAMDPLSRSYIIVATGEDTAEFRGRRRYRLRTEVYDSTSACWAMAGDALPEAKFGSDPGVWCGGRFFCITELPYGLTVFNLAMGRWTELDVEMPTGIAVPSLLSCNGQLMMVGIQEDTDMEYRFWSSSSKQLTSLLSVWLSVQPWLMISSAPRLSSPLLTSQLPQPYPKRSIKLWRLEQGKHWRVVDRMPEDMCAGFMAQMTPRTGLVCAGVGDKVCITTHQSQNAAVFDLNRKDWRYAASDPLFPRNRNAHLLGFTIQPDCVCVP